MERISIYTDTSKQEEFINRMNAIVNNQNSKISFCSIEKGVSNNFSLFLHPINSLYSFNTLHFDFCSLDIEIKDENDYDRYLKEGYSREDIDSLHSLLKEFCFKNFYEGQFFASRFRELSNIEKCNAYVFKFLTDEKNNRFNIEGKYLERTYAIVSRDEAITLIKDIESVGSFQVLKARKLPYRSHSQSFKTSVETIKSFNSYKNDEYVIVDFYKYYDRAYDEIYLDNIWMEVDSEIQTMKLKDYK